jgi:hypothetical protein
MKKASGSSKSHAAGDRPPGPAGEIIGIAVHS